jgi:hypothetical protein
MKYNPEPWYIQNDLMGCPGVRNSGGFICFTRSITRYPDQEERYYNECDARDGDVFLVSAAPKMYNTLLEIARYLGNRPFRSDGEELILARCREAIAKAEGND